MLISWKKVLIINVIYNLLDKGWLCLSHPFTEIIRNISSVLLCLPFRHFILFLFHKKYLCQQLNEFSFLTYSYLDLIYVALCYISINWNMFSPVTLITKEKYKKAQLTYISKECGIEISWAIIFEIYFSL